MNEEKQPSEKTIDSETLLFYNSIKSKRTDGHAVRTSYFITKRGIIQIYIRIASTELNEGFREIRRFKNLIYQEKNIGFKLETFAMIAQDVHAHIPKLDHPNIVLLDDVIYPLNTKGFTTVSLKLPK
jgi:hypothetical protein